MDIDTNLLLILSFKGSHSVIQCEGFLVSFHLALVGLLYASRLESITVVLQPKGNVVLSSSGKVGYILHIHSRVVPGCCFQEGEAGFDSPKTRVMGSQSRVELTYWSMGGYNRGQRAMHA